MSRISKLDALDQAAHVVIKDVGVVAEVEAPVPKRRPDRPASWRVKVGNRSCEPTGLSYAEAEKLWRVHARAGECPTLEKEKELA